jgi:uncharacterized heparinase superfamily protein
MKKLKSIKMYFFSILKLSSLSFRNYYLSSSYYNKNLVNFIPDRIFYNPSTNLCASLTTINNDFYKITNTSPELLWENNIKDKQQFNNLHNFLWLAKLDRKNSKKITKGIIKSWINLFFDYNINVWEMEITAKRIIAWVSNTDITLEDSDKIYKQNFFLSVIKQSNFLLRNIKNLQNGSTKIICCSAIILSGLIFKENDSNYVNGLKELEKIIKSYFGESGFPKSRNPEEVFISLKYLIIIREWFKESQKVIPNFLNEIISKCGNCYSILSYANNQFPLFNGGTEINNKNYDVFLKNFKYKFTKNSHEVAGFLKVKKKNFEFFIDCGNPPPDSFEENYQAGCLSFELISNKQKVICNSGFGKYLSLNLTSLSRSTASHSSLYINDTSSCLFQKNKIINKAYGCSLIEKHKITNKNYVEDKNFYFISATHNGYEKKFGYTHSRSIKIFKNKDKILGHDELRKTKKYSNAKDYSIRFHVYPETKIVKTKGGNSVLISLSNGEGWLLQTDNNINIEKNIFFGKKNKIINSESICISGVIDKKMAPINWSIEKVK